MRISSIPPALLTAVLVFPAPGRSATILVPDDRPTIQGAIDAAENGDTIVVRSGTYVENIDFLGKAITVQSEEGPEATTIDGNQAGSVVTFRNREGPDSVLEGMTITNGRNGRGGGVVCLRSSPTLVDNVILGNRAETDGGGYPFGGGVFCYRSSAILIRNTIRENVARGNDRVHGGGVGCWDSSPTLTECTITDNVARTDGFGPALGGGLYLAFVGDVLITQSEIAGNTVRGMEFGAEGAGAGIYVTFGSGTLSGNNIHENTTEIMMAKGSGMQVEDSRLTLTNTSVYANGHATAIEIENSLLTITNSILYGNCCTSRQHGIRAIDSVLTATNSILWANRSPQIRQQRSTLVVTYCDVQGGFSGAGNIAEDPLFVDPEGGDFHLRLGSPCVDAGTNEALDLPDVDPEGDERTVDGDLDDLAVVDIGADEMRPEIAARFGTVNAASGALASVLRLNGSPGGDRRVYETSTGLPLSLTMDAPPSGPETAPFVLYLWSGEGDETSMDLQPFHLGTMCMPTFITGNDPLPARVWNNLGHEGRLGTPTRPSSPAPSVIGTLPAGARSPVTVTLQGFIRDDASGADGPLSITNALIVKVE